MIKFIRGILLLLIGCLSVAQAADTGWQSLSEYPQAKIRLRADTASGEKVRLLLDVQLAEGWKTYWRSPGEGGVAPEIKWDNGAATEWWWPVPQRFDVSGLTAQGYKERVSFPLALIRPSSTRLRGVVRLPICSNLCVLADYPVDIDLNEVASDGFDIDYAQAFSRIPAATGPITVTEAHFSHNAIMLSASNTAEWEQPTLFVDTLAGASLSKPMITTTGNVLTATIPVTDEWGEPVKNLTRRALSLVLTSGKTAQQLSVPLASPNVTVTAFWAILLSAMVGGLILNLMPCVLPVLGMKLSSVLMVAQEEQRWIRWRFLATTAGILTSFILLALLMTGLRLTGAATGWGIQFQNPWFIGLMVLVTFLFSVNLAGLFTLRLPTTLNTRLATAGGKGMLGSFCEGMFATLLATPCSAPFLGTAVTFALAAPLYQLWSVFLALGMGMSLPWLAIAAIPRLICFLPKPGHWMNKLRLILAMMMLGSSLWLLSLFTAFIDTRYVVLLGGAVLALTLLLVAWKYRRQAQNVRTLAFTLLIGTAFYAFLAPSDNDPHLSPIPWQPLTEPALQQALSEGKRVFIDVTANWCINCKVNELLVLHRPEVVNALKQPDVVALQGNWTTPSIEIKQFFQRHGGGGVPYNAIFSPRYPQGTVLSPLLNKQTLLETLESAKG